MARRTTAVAEPIEWVTLKEAATRTGASISALRKWYRNETVRSELRPGPHGEQRYVALADVAARAEAMGVGVIDRPGESPERVVASGRGILIPREQFDSVMAQLGNLHQAGQDLAEARERAAIAETKAEHLRERVAELRAVLQRTNRPGIRIRLRRADDVPDVG